MLSALIFFITGALSTIDGFSRSSGGRAYETPGITARDTTQTTRDSIPLGISMALSSPPRVETVRLAVGIGPMFNDFTELEHLGIEKSNLTLPLSLYLYVPFQKYDPTLYFLGGWDFSTNLTFKAMLMYRTQFGALFGMGAGNTTSYHFDDELDMPNFDAFKTYGVAVLGVNFIPGALDLVLTIPLGSSLTTEFEDRRYKIRPAGFHVSLLVSI